MLKSVNDFEGIICGLFEATIPSLILVYCDQCSLSLTEIPTLLFPAVILERCRSAVNAVATCSTLAYYPTCRQYKFCHMSGFRAYKLHLTNHAIYVNTRRIR
jgi:hypothetical protein